MKTRRSHRTILSIVAVALAWLPTELHAQFAYVANAGSNDVSGYMIDSTTGALTPIPGSPFPAGFFPCSLAVDPAGRFAYVANASSANVSGYRINPTSGGLTPIPGSPFPAEVGPCSVAVDRVARSFMWRVPSSFLLFAVTFRGTRSTPPAGRSRPSPDHPSRPRKDRFRYLWPWTRVAGSFMWRVPRSVLLFAVAFRDTRSTPPSGRSRPSPDHPSRRERVRPPWQRTRAASSPM